MYNVVPELPFDVLCIIFEYCAEFDCRSSPLERLLLVCRAWSNMALSQSSIWSTYNMEIASIMDMFYWNACVPQRLTRSHNSLDIRIRMPISRHVHLIATFETLMIHLVGDSGEIARRWCCFVLHDAYGCIPGHILARYLCFPTPMLQEIACSWLSGEFAILPDTSALKTLRISNMQIKYPDISNVTDLEIGARTTFDGLECVLDEHALTRAINVEIMKINCRSPFKLDAIYNHLKALTIKGFVAKDCLRTFRAPNLTDLTLHIDSGEAYHHVVSCEGIDIGSLRRAHIMWHLHGQEYSMDDVADYVNGLRRFLMATISLEILELGDRDMGSMVLKLIEDDCKRLYQSHGLHLVLGEYDMELGRGEGRLPSIRRFSKENGCVYHDRWDDTYEYFASLSRGEQSLDYE